MNPKDFQRSQLSYNTDIEDILRRPQKLISPQELIFIQSFLSDPDIDTIQSSNQLQVCIRKHLKTTKTSSFKKNKLLYYLRNNQINQYNHLLPFLVKKQMKHSSGVLVITVLTSPYPVVKGKVQSFSCQWDCHYCPKEPGQPRSYLHDEPAVLRANQNSFDPILQLTDRCMSLYLNGHPIDKLEILVLGGTWSSYPIEYRENFIRDLFYAANTFNQIKPRHKESLEIEKQINESTGSKIIGITLETRPDCITRKEIIHFRKVGCTRVQLGVQHTDDTILKKINRKCYTKDTIQALRLLKDNGYKVDIHLMTQLPGTIPDMDRKMFQRILYDPDLQADQWKIYPCAVVPWTKIKEWHDKGEYIPYSDEELIELLIDIKSQVHPWIRLNRIFRDIPSQYISGGTTKTNLRQILETKMQEQGKACKCIRCREVGLQKSKNNDNSQHMTRRDYIGSKSQEIFLSIENSNKSIIYGFLRLRLPSKDTLVIFPELKDLALIRELHVYGSLHEVGIKKIKSIQHTGLGKILLKKAEWISWIGGYKGLAIIAGVGTRNYYRKRGYHLHPNGEYMIKHFNYKPILYLLLSSIFIIICCIYQYISCFK